jgi:hypothetical protein
MEISVADLTRRPMERVLGGSTRSWVNQSCKLERPLSNGTGGDREGRSLKRGPFYICGRGREDEELGLHFFQRRWPPFKKKRRVPMTSHSTNLNQTHSRLPTMAQLDPSSSLLSSSISLDSSE